MALEKGVFLHRSPDEGPGRGCCFTVDFERKLRFLFIRRPCMLGNPRYM